MPSSTVGGLGQGTPEPRPGGLAPIDEAEAVADHPGMTWATLAARQLDGRSFVLVGRDEFTNAYRGDTSPARSLPILAFRRTAVPKPSDLPARAWPGGEVRLTEPVAGTRLTSLEAANRIVAGELGEEWSMASFHQVRAGWRFWAEGTLEPGGERYWVYIRDQPANPWTRLALATGG